MSGFSQIRQLRFDRLSLEDGLPANGINCLLQDKDGYIWFGTINGLVRYDGYNLTIYRLATADKKELANCVISAVYEDSKGNIWAGTARKGLFRYNRSSDDFTRFSHTRKEEEISIGKDIITTIVEDHEGIIWTVSENGILKGSHLDRLDPATGTITTFDSIIAGNHNIRSKRFKKLISDAKGQIWLATENGLFLYHKKQDQFIGFFTNTDPEKRTIISDVYEAPSQPDVLWLSQQSKSKNGLVQFNVKDKISKLYVHSDFQANSLVNDTVLTVFEDRSRRLWIGTANGLCLFNRQTERFATYLPADKQGKANANNCFNIKEGRDGALWILTGNGVLYLSSPKAELKRFLPDHSEVDGLPAKVLRNSLIDRSGIMWIGMGNFGLLRVNEQRSQFEYINKTVKNGGLAVIASSISRFKNGNYLVATSMDLYECDSLLQRFNLINITTKNKDKAVSYVVKIDTQGIAWIGTWGQGLFRYDPLIKKFTQFVNEPKDSLSISANFILSLCVDRRGNLWIGTRGGGLCGLDSKTGKFHRYPYIVNLGSQPKNGELDDDDVYSIYEDRGGILWVGTKDGGLNRWDQKIGRFTSYFADEKGLNSITALCEDWLGRMWVGTYFGGLFLFDRQTANFKRFTEKEGLVYNNVSSICEDDSGNLWVSSNRGYSILNPVDFSIKTLTTQNGLPNGNLSYDTRVIAGNGDWVVPSFQGIITFHPERLIVNPVPPQVLIQSLTFTKQVSGQANLQTILLSGQTEVEFDYNENRISFQYVGLHYTNPQLNQYKYKLAGFDKDWISAGYERTVTYTNISPGTYSFLVKAANADGLWSKHEARINVVIHPPWWQTWWAYTLYVLLFAFAVWSYVSYRSKALLRHNKVLEEKVSHRTGQLQKSLQDLKTTQTQLIQSEKMASLGELTAGIAHEIQNPLNFVNNFSEVSVELVDDLKKEATEGNKEEVIAIADDIAGNLQKVVHHGKRADAIVKGMLEHSRASTGKKEPTDINALADEYLRLSYHGLRAKDKDFNADFKTDFDGTIGKIEVVPQDIGRVLLNLYNNAFYAASLPSNGGFNNPSTNQNPTVWVSTKMEDEKVVIRVKDNGPGIPEKIVDKIFQPFFTTRPTGHGTGLGLSLSYDITKAHGGELKVETKEGEGAEFTIQLPVI